MPPTQVPELNLLRREVVARAARLEVRFRTRLAELSRQRLVRGPQLARLRLVRRPRGGQLFLGGAQLLLRRPRRGRRRLLPQLEPLGGERLRSFGACQVLHHVLLAHERLLQALLELVDRDARLLLDLAHVEALERLRTPVQALLQRLHELGVLEVAAVRLGDGIRLVRAARRRGILAWRVGLVCRAARRHHARLGDESHGRKRLRLSCAAGRAHCGGARDALALHGVEPGAERTQIGDASRALARWRAGSGRSPARGGRGATRAVARVEVRAQTGLRRRRGRAEAGLGRRGGLHERPARAREGGLRQVLLVVRVGVGHGASEPPIRSSARVSRGTRTRRRWVFSMCVRARYVRATTNACARACFPSSDVSRGRNGFVGNFRDSCLGNVRPRQVGSAESRNRELIFFLSFSARRRD